MYLSGFHLFFAASWLFANEEELLGEVAFFAMPGSVRTTRFAVNNRRPAAVSTTRLR